MKFTYLVSIYKEYRNLVFYRLKARGIICRVFAILTMVFLPRMDSLKLYADYIGWNLYIEHGIGTILSAKRIGDNCWVNQQVTIGYNLDGKSPIIGDGVRVCAGSKILGGIEIEDNAIIGAGAVVVKSVERMSIVVGVPAQKIGINSEHKLI